MTDTQRMGIVGAGMAGLVAAVQAQALGARVVLLEKGATLSLTPSITVIRPCWSTCAASGSFLAVFRD